MDVHLLEPTSIIDDTKRDLSDAISSLGGVSAIINFNCGHRSIHLEKSSLEDEHSDMFKGLPAIGFSTYGEYYITLVNNTSTMLLLK